MRKLLRSMAKAEMVHRGYSKVNRRMSHSYGGWRAVIGAYPINLVTGKKMPGTTAVRRSIRRGTIPISSRTEQD